MNQKHRTLALTLSILLLAPALVSISSLQIRIYQVKKEVKILLINQLPSSDLIQFTFDKVLAAQLEWEDDLEFKYEGKMYDVIAADTVGEMIHYTCWPDHEETVLNQLLTKSVIDYLAGNHAHGRDKQMLQSYQDFKYLISVLLPDSYPWCYFLAIHTNWDKPIFKPVYYTPPTPPPLV